MGKYSRELSEDLIHFIEQQKIFFTATAPSDDGRINLSPKGYDSLVVLNPTTIAYLDYAGSGNETANHIKDNQKITLMWCSFDTDPLILRVYGYGEILEKQSPAYTKHMEQHFSAVPESKGRQIIVIAVEAIQTSCGFGVPWMDFKGDREKLAVWTDNQVEKGMLDTYIEKNSQRLEEKFPLGNKV